MAVEPPSPLSRFGMFLLAGAVGAILALWGVLKYLERTTPPRAVVQTATPAPATGAPAGGPGKSATPMPTATPAPAPSAEERERAQLTANIRDALAVLRDPNNPNKKAALDALREVLDHATPKVAIAAIREFLKTGEDAQTGLRFKVGEGGVLDEAPSLRTFLMDDLGVLSRDNGTADAAEVAREVFATKGSADEWALAMRNLGWSDPEGSRAEIAAKAREMLAYAPWAQAPSGGFFEAFDAIPFSGDASFIAQLGPLATGNSPLQRAALIALERLSTLAPGPVADYLNAHPEALAERPLVRADYMGNVNLSDPAQLAAAETYLQRADVSQAEKEKFLARLGTPAGFVSNNLLTPTDAMSMTLADHKAMVNGTATTWLASGKYPALQSALQTLVNETAAKTGAP